MLHIRKQNIDISSSVLLGRGLQNNGEVASVILILGLWVVHFLL